MLAKRWNRVTLWVSLSVLAGVAIGLSESFQDCEHTQKKHRVYWQLYEKGPITVGVEVVRAATRLRLHLACTAETAHQNEGPLTLLATLLIAGFTATLWRATNRLWQSAENELAEFQKSLKLQRIIADEQIAKMGEYVTETRNAATAAKASTELAQKEFVSTHRPRLIIRNINLRQMVADQEVAIQFAIVNKGQTDAARVEWRMGVIVLNPSQNIFGLEAVTTVTQSLGASLSSGMDHVSNFESPQSFNERITASVMKGNSRLLFCGVIAYFDGGGNVRRTGFVRRLDPPTGRFHLTDNPDDEYED